MTTKPTLYWHIHHEILIEETFNIQERIDYIREGKPEDEIPLRLKLMTPVLHPEKLPARFRKAREAYYKASKARDKASKAYDKAMEACTPQIEKLHKEEHPDCPWNGKTIFSEVD